MINALQAGSEVKGQNERRSRPVQDTADHSSVFSARQSSSGNKSYIGIGSFACFVTYQQGFSPPCGKIELAHGTSSSGVTAST